MTTARAVRQIYRLLRADDQVDLQLELIDLAPTAAGSGHHLDPVAGGYLVDPGGPPPHPRLRAARGSRGGDGVGGACASRRGVQAADRAAPALAPDAEPARRRHRFAYAAAPLARDGRVQPRSQL
ncbi:MAG: hypothetical protein ACREX8_16115 [Gammaproteobacteria bacterium]